jgi:hypothetical protein
LFHHPLARAHIGGVIGPANHWPVWVHGTLTVDQHGTGLEDLLQGLALAGGQCVLKRSQGGGGHADGIQDVHLERLVTAPIAALATVNSRGRLRKLLAGRLPGLLTGLMQTATQGGGHSRSIVIPQARQQLQSLSILLDIEAVDQLLLRISAPDQRRPGLQQALQPFAHRTIHR